MSTYSTKVRRDGHVARMGEMRNEYKILVAREKDHSEDLGVDGRVISE
jgi:hypothetical protein